MFHRISYITSGAGFLPSTVSLAFLNLHSSSSKVGDKRREWPKISLAFDLPNIGGSKLG